MHSVSNSLTRRLGPATRLLLALAIMVTGFRPAATTPAFADHPNGRHFLWWTFEGDIFATYGANATINIDLGAIEFLPNCATFEAGVDDVFFPHADVYIVPSGSVSLGSTLQDVSLHGVPNTVIGASDGTFTGETIAFTRPIGELGPGTYAVIYDECRDGTFDSVDFKLDPAFEVTILANVPALDVAGEKILELKTNAAAQADSWLVAKYGFESLLEGPPEVPTIPGSVEEAVDALVDAQVDAILDPLVDELLAELEQAIEGKYGFTFPKPKEGALDLVDATIAHWIAIAGDPPDPNFSQLSPLVQRPLLEPASADPVVARAIDAGTQAGNEAALAEGLLHSLERYQGADQGNDGDWALLHARAIQRYALLLAGQLAHSDAALAAFAAALAADTRPLDEAAAELQAFRVRIAATGFTADELRMLRNLGFSADDLAGLQVEPPSADGSSFSKGDLLAAVADLQAVSASTAEGLSGLAAAMQSLVAELEADPGVSNLAPLANPGGPYNGVEGSPIAFSGLASTSKLAINLFEWDLDGDGDFDDATGASPSFTYQRAFQGLVGVRVTNAAGLADLAYAPIWVADTNSPPALLQYGPALHSSQVLVGTTQVFSVTVADADDDAFSVAWQLDGVPAGNGPDLGFTPTAEQVGLHYLDAIIADASELGGSVRLLWLVAVLEADADSDLWRANVDCDDTQAGVHPGATEVVGNGLDDDCDPATLDDDQAPVALFVPRPASGGTNLASYWAGVTVQDFSFVPNWSFNSPERLLIDNVLGPYFWLVYGPRTIPRWVKLLLPGGRVSQIDRVMVAPFSDSPTQAARDFAIAVSTTSADDAAFTTVYTGTTAQNRQLQEFSLPAPVLAKYVRYTVLANWGNSIGVETAQLRVMSGQESYDHTVTFEDRSTDVEGEIAAWAWDFGDGSPPSAERSPTHTFPDGSGNYTVTLTVTDAAGTSSTFSLEQRVLSFVDPIAPVLPEGRPDSKATDFWLAFTSNFDPSQLVVQTLSLFISGEAATTGTVTLPRLHYAIPFSVTPGVVTRVPIPSYASLYDELHYTDGLQPTGIHVTAGAEVTVYGLSRIPATTDAFLALPTDVLGTDHLILGYNGFFTQFAIVATADNTTVRIVPSTFSTTGRHPTGVPFTLTMQAGQTYQFMGGDGISGFADVSGTRVTSDKPVAVYGGHACTVIPFGYQACDHLVEQIPPVAAWGRNFATMPLATRLRGDTFRFLAAEDDTSIHVNGGPAIMLNRGQNHERIIAEPAHITATKPILVAQYSNSSTWDNVVSDPFMMLIPPYEQFMDRYIVSTPSSGFRFNFINLVASAAAVGEIVVDGTPIPAERFVPIGDSAFYGTQVTVTLGSHALSGPLPFGAFVYGFDVTDSYGYPGGTALAQVARVRNVVLTPPAGTRVVESAHCVAAFLTDEGGQPVPGARVDFNVSGANLATGFAVADNGGQASYCYAGSQTGMDEIVATVGDLAGQASFNWTPLNSAPAAEAGLDQTMAEGTALTLDGGGSSDPEGDELDYAWDLDSEAGFETLGQVITLAGDTLDGPAEKSVALQVTDTGGLSVTDTVQISIHNLAPAIVGLTVPGSQVPVGGAVDASATFADPGALDTHTAAWDWGDGSTTPGDVLETGGSGLVSGQHAYATAGTYLVTLTVTDDDGAAATAVSEAIVVYVPNQPPAVAAGGPYTIDEGASVTVTATGFDPEHTPLSYAWDLDNDGVFEAAGQSVSFSAALLDGPGTTVIGVQVTDAGGLSVMNHAAVAALNVSPVVGLPLITAASIPAGAVVASATFSDPASDDAPFTCAVDYGAGAGSQPGTLSGNTCAGPAYVYPGVGSWLVTLTVTDKDGGVGTNTVEHRQGYDFGGFYQPVDNLPMLNSVNAGRAIPVKFSLSGYQGLDILAAGYPRSQQIACSSTDLVDGIEETSSAGASSLSYDADSDRYHYVWKTEKAWAGTCRQFILKLADGTFHYANFKFK